MLTLRQARDNRKIWLNMRDVSASSTKRDAALHPPNSATFQNRRSRSR
jgi:hypothetical protein